MARNTFHVSLNVSDLGAATERYRKLLGIEPAKVREDFVKFELEDPPAIISLNRGGEPGTIGHLGIRYPGTADVATELVRMQREQMDIYRQEDVICCHARADKFWVSDTDGVRWEMYAVTEDR